MQNIGHRIVRYETVNSTNDVAKQLAEEGAEEGVVVVAQDQTAGRGRRGRVWTSSSGKSVCFSVILKPAWKDSDVNWLGVLGGVAAADALRSLGLSGVTVKWPNDVLVNGRKIAGVLVEPRLSKNELAFAVLGIGINVRQQAEDWPETVRSIATSCLLEGVDLDCERVIQKLLEKLNTFYLEMKKSGPQSVSTLWRDWSGSSRLPVLN